MSMSVSSVERAVVETIIRINAVVNSSCGRCRVRIALKAVALLVGSSLRRCGCCIIDYRFHTCLPRLLQSG